ncbi:hypothetical protein AGLY_016358 [Aphis glycines]|uniref:Rad60/SUMO-like domain-containing protein n=1 Tax=Aphis glycines TaxID=307491 RepID=A0A6G0SYN1_APHGL|nr:hypothetical protein AGLY_016358 [Aphis glycines]
MSNKNIMDLSDEEDDNPYDFVAQYRKLEMERKNKINESPVDCEEVTIISSTSSQTEIVVDAKQDGLPSYNLRSKRTKKSTNSDVNTDLNLTASTSDQSKPRRNRQRSKSSDVNTDLNLTASTSGQSKPQRNRQRSKRNKEPENVNGSVICIGDFYDGYNMPPPKIMTEISNDDKLEDVENIMANWKKRQIEEAELEDALAQANRIMNVKVYWRKMRTHCFSLRMHQSISSIYEHFAKLEDIDPSYVRLDLHNKLLSPKDTPNSINYKIIDFIDGDIEFYKSPYDTPDVPEVEEEPQDEMVQFHVKQKDVKRPITIELKKTDKMLIMYIKLKELLGFDIDSFTLEFDGDKVKFMDTMKSLDLEGGECFELFQKN